MNEKQNTINCPKCGEEFDVNHQIEQKVKKQYDEELRAEKQNVYALVKEALEEIETCVTVVIAEEVAKEQAGAMNSLQEEVKEKSSKVKLLNQDVTRTKLQIEGFLKGLRR
jgi:hypothetical protein